MQYPSSNSSNSGFRNDINAIRGVAVLLVVLYHFDIPGFAGGFIGVDVFFVLSGYLMTAIIGRGLASGNLSIMGFYAARARRIVPALVGTCSLLMLLGWVYIDPAAYRNLAKHALASLSFTSNIIYLRESGYFDVSTQTKWLIHTWSLSTEWQFYMVYPLGLYAVRARITAQPGYLRRVLLVTGAISFLFAVVLSATKPEASFYLFPTRIWEMICGGLVFTLKNSPGLPNGKRSAAITQSLLLVVLLGSSTIIDNTWQWPSLTTLIPVLATSIFIALNRSDTFIPTFLPLQFLGKVSYSLYLWHWPVWVSLAYFQIETTLTVKVIGIFAAMILSYLSFVLIEKPFIHSSKTPKTKGRKVTLPLCYLAFLSLGCTAILASNGSDFRLDPAARKISGERFNIEPRRAECVENSLNRYKHNPADLGCLYGKKDQAVGVIVWGDSHGGAVVSAVAAVTQQKQLSTIFLGSGGCPPLEHASTFELGVESKCREFSAASRQRLSAQSKDIPVILIARYAAYLHGRNEDNNPKTIAGIDGHLPETNTFRRSQQFTQLIEDNICSLAKERKVFVLLPIPEIGRNVPETLTRILMQGKSPSDVTIPLSSYQIRNEAPISAIKNAARRCNAVTLDPTTELCDSTKCYGSVGLFPTYQDDDHLSESGNKMLVKLFAQTIRQ